MKRDPADKILSHAAPASFIGRENELAEILALAQDPRSASLALLAAPASGASELLRQTFDAIFAQPDAVAPVLFAVRPNEPGAAAAVRFARTVLTQTIAYSRRDAWIIKTSPGIRELTELARPDDGRWVDRVAQAACSAPADETTFDAELFSSPMRAAAARRKIFVMIDATDAVHSGKNGDLVRSLAGLYGSSDISFVFAGMRRSLFGLIAARPVHLGRLGRDRASQLAKVHAADLGVEAGDECCDLIAVQLAGSPGSIKALITSAAHGGEHLDSFIQVQRHYAQEVFGGRFARSLDDYLHERIPPGIIHKVKRLLHVFANAGGVPSEYWQRELDIPAPELDNILTELHAAEFVNWQNGSVKVHLSDVAVTDHCFAVTRVLEGENRAAIFADSVTSYIKRSPALLAEAYVHTASIGVRALLDSFNGQTVASALFDYGLFKEKLKGLASEALDVEISAATELITLPQIGITTCTAELYPKIGLLLHPHRTAVASGFVDGTFQTPVNWIAAEVDSKLETDREVAEFWLDRLEMAAVECNFDNYKIWLIAPEGFTPEAVEVLAERNALGSSRQQAELLAVALTSEQQNKATPPVDYEIVIPMGDESEMIAAHNAEEIAKRHGFAQKAVNQIKTAIVEACINASEHSLSPDRRIRITFSAGDGHLAITVINRGVRLVDKQDQPQASPNTRRGWGLKLMRGLMDEVTVEATDDGTRLTMIKKLPKAAE